ncbi:hypothetical protein NM688_g3513 [Phlebia brevispora]|uniref:Uncharacterized protein n=1 Tax=Phlebia brevispora TaxID=194682 RepID=A0ACC1T667_9APHY|nr:hypothetical protein NM688_g3513 [Phlebia brevispora]
MFSSSIILTPADDPHAIGLGSGASPVSSLLFLQPPRLTAMAADPQSDLPPLPDPSANITPKPYLEKFRNRPLTKFVDPCEDAAKASMECLNRHDYNRDKCTDFFQAYRDCKKTWMDQRKADRRAGRPTE